MDNRRIIDNFVVTGFLWLFSIATFSKNRWLDSHLTRYCCNPDHPKPTWDLLALHKIEQLFSSIDVGMPHMGIYSLRAIRWVKQTAIAIGKSEVYIWLMI